MDTLHEALRVVADAAGVPGLATDAAGYAALDLPGGAMRLYLQVAGDSEIELSVRVDGFGPGMTPEQLNAALRANGRMATGRLSLDPQGGGVVFGQRIELAGMTPEALVAALNGFVVEAARFQLNGAKALIDGAVRYASPAPEAFIRV